MARRRASARFSHDDSAPTKAAATLILARDGAQGLELYMMKRTEKVVFGGAYVFPGGSVDSTDGAAHWDALSPGFDDAAASRKLNLPAGGRAYWIAAIRECFEEAGLLLAHDALGKLVNLDAPGRDPALDAARKAVAAGELDFAAFLAARGLRPATELLHYYSHWITPLGAPRRFDTRFFVAAAPAAQTASHDDGENVDHAWIRPADALEGHRAGTLKLIVPTIRTLEAMLAHATLRELIDYVSAPRAIPEILPRRATSASGTTRTVLPHEPAYAEVRKLDPGGMGAPPHEIVPGVATRLSPLVKRLTAPNPGYMTGPGTNSYLIGNTEIAVIDPGPPDAGHIEALIREAGAPIRWIFATHTHPDHSPGAALLKARTGAMLLGMAPPPGEHQDRSFAPDNALTGGSRVALDGATLRAIHTPGHASNHLCYLLEEEKLLFTGDHIMQGSTVVINPPDGDMQAYFAALRALLAEDIEWLAPGHGFLIDNPHKVVEQLIAHRLGRENKVLQKLGNRGSATLDELLPEVYDDVPALIHPVARRSLFAHLLKLQAEQRVVEQAGAWGLR